MALALNNLNVSRNLARVKFPYRIEDAQAFIALQRSFDPRSLTCAITFHCAPDELIGVVAYEFSSEKNNTEFGYWLRECCWNMGIMSEAAAALVAHAFTTSEITELHSAYHLDNPNSGRILHRLGFEMTCEKMHFSLAQNKDVPAAKLCLNRARWLEQQKGRTT
jgi:RimJ/RimL family protein N-acetyltransferase